MAVYGRLIKTVNEDGGYENVSFDQLTEFIYESDNEMNLMFEKVNLITILKEENTSLVIPKNINYNGDNSEQLKKKFSEKIKDLFNKFLDWVKTAFKNLQTKVIQLYQKYNLQDQFFSKWKNKITWEALEECKKEGWKGIPISVASVIEPISIQDTNLIYFFKDDFKELNELISKLSDCENEDSLNNNEKKIKDAINEIRKINNTEKADTSIIKNRNFEVNLGEKNPFVGYLKNTGAPDDQHYYPNKQMFITNKQFAESGQKQIKNINITGNASIKLVKDITLANKKTILDSSEDNYKKDKENLNNKIDYLICKYSYESTSLFITVSSKSLNGMIKLLWFQHKCAVQNYILYIQAINKYCKN